MTATKTANYTAEQTAKLVADYKAGVSVEAIAQELDKSVRSVVAKLSREGVYTPKTKLKDMNAPVRKADLIAKIAHSIDANEELLESLEKATKEALELLADALERTQAANS